MESVLRCHKVTGPTPERKPRERKRRKGGEKRREGKGVSEIKREKIGLILT